MRREAGERGWLQVFRALEQFRHALEQAADVRSVHHAVVSRSHDVGLGDVYKRQR